MSTIFAKAVNGVIRTARRRTVQLYSITVSAHGTRDDKER